MEIHYAGKVSKSDWAKALRLQNPGWTRQKWYFGAFIVLIIFSGIFTAIRTPDVFVQMIQSIYPPYLALPLIGLTFPWWREYLQIASFDQKGNIYLNNIHGMINESEVTIDSGDVQAAFKWTVFTDCKANQDICILLQGPNRFSIFTPSLFSNHEEWQKFIALAKEKVAINKKRK